MYKNYTLKPHITPFKALNQRIWKYIHVRCIKSLNKANKQHRKRSNKQVAIGKCYLLLLLERMEENKNMSYEIVYNSQFLKIDGKIIPLVLHGSNNCYETLNNGRQIRERNWNPLYIGINKPIAATEAEIMKEIESCCGGEYQDHFMQNGKWVDDKGLIRFFQNGVKNAKTIEELKDNYFFMGMYGYFSVWKGMGNIIENRVEISTSDDLRKFLDAAQNRLDRKTEKEEIYICLKYYNEKFESRVKPERKTKERLTDYFVIKVGNRDSYLVKQTSRRIRHTSLCNLTKQFKTEKEANKYVEKLIEKGFTCDFSVEHIVA